MKTYKTFLDAMHAMRELANNVYPDKYKHVCMEQGIRDTVAMDMYSHFLTIVEGHTPYQDGKALSDEQMAKIIDIAVQADRRSGEAEGRIELIRLNSSWWGDKLNHILVVWTPKDGTGKQFTEMDLSVSDTYVTIGRMIENGNMVDCIIRQSDQISSTSSCMSLDPKERGKKSFNIYDGDVILAYVDRPGWWRSDAKDSGLYLCQNGSYRRLLYTPGKGYVRKGSPDCDEDFKLDIAEDAFNNHILTMSQKWKRIGNVHVDIGFLIEQ